MDKSVGRDIRRVEACSREVLVLLRLLLVSAESEGAAGARPARMGMG